MSPLAQSYPTAEPVVEVPLLAVLISATARHNLFWKL